MQEEERATRRAVLAHPARRLRDAAEPLAMHATGSPQVRAALAGLGLDRFRGYVGARSASLGEPAPPVVVAAFGVFEPRGLENAFASARRLCAGEVLLQTRAAATVASLRQVLADEQVDGAVAVLRRGLSAAPTVGRPLFAGLSGRPWPDDPVGRLWRACELLREHRGDTHLAVCVPFGLDPVEMNVLTELWHGMPVGRYTATRGWNHQQVDAAVRQLRRRGLVEGRALSRDGLDLRNEMEARTNAGQSALVEAIGTDLEALLTRLADWSTACVEAGAFTADEGKRAAG